MTNRDQIIRNYVDFFMAGCKDPADLKYGLEAEHFVVFGDSQKAVPYAGANGVCSLLHELTPHFPKEYWMDGHLLGLYGDEAAITLEPGSQLELSVAAAAEVSELAAAYRRCRAIIDPILAARGQELLAIGYQPRTKAAEIALLPRCRYSYMDEHFRRTGRHGIHMMRGTASCQVILDYTSEADFIEKYQSACLLLPLLDRKSVV